MRVKLTAKSFLAGSEVRFGRVPRLAGRSSQESRSAAKASSIADEFNVVIAESAAVPCVSLAFGGELEKRSAAGSNRLPPTCVSV